MNPGIQTDKYLFLSCILSFNTIKKNQAALQKAMASVFLSSVKLEIFSRVSLSVCKIVYVVSVK